MQDDGDGPIPLAAPEPMNGAGAGRLASGGGGGGVGGGEEGGFCPACSRGMARDAVLCIHCGFDRRTGFTRRTGVDAAATKTGTLTCPSCGYDLTGLRKRVCPECGETNLGRNNAKAKQRQAQKESVALWVLPTAMLVVGSVISIWHVARLGGGEVAVKWAIGTSFCVLGAFVGYSLIAMLLTGWAYGLGQSLLRIGGILMILTAGTILVPLGGGIIAMLLGWFVLCVMLITIMDLDINDGWMVTTAVLAGWICGGLLGSVVVGLIS
jgi:hypothetical protein